MWWVVGGGWRAVGGVWWAVYVCVGGAGVGVGVVRCRNCTANDSISDDMHHQQGACLHAPHDDDVAGEQTVHHELVSGRPRYMYISTSISNM